MWSSSHKSILFYVGLRLKTKGSTLFSIVACFRTHMLTAWLFQLACIPLHYINLLICKYIYEIVMTKVKNYLSFV